MRRHNNRWFFCAVCVALLSSVVNARQGDREQPIKVITDRSEYSEALQRQTLTGNVVITQGSMVVHADKVIVFLKNGALDRLDANGNPATFQQLDDAGQLLSGQSLHVEYAAAEGDLALLGDAKLTTPDQSLAGDRIDYNINTQAATSAGGKQRANIILQPNTDETQ